MTVPTATPVLSETETSVLVGERETPSVAVAETFRPQGHSRTSSRSSLSSSNNNNANALDDPELDLPPFRLNATRVPERLTSSLTTLQQQQHHIRHRSGEWPRGRSRSPSMKDGENSSISSLDSSDIFTDRMGFEDFDVQKQKAMALDGSVSSLQPVQERLSDDTLEDVRAFSDVTRTTGSVSSRANSIATGGDVGSLLLETLDECDDEEDGGVHISNLDEISEEDGAASSHLEHLPSDDRGYSYTDDDLPAPLRFNAVRVPDRLAMSHSSFFTSNQSPSTTTTNAPTSTAAATATTFSPAASPHHPSNRRRPLPEEIGAALKKGGTIDLNSSISSLGDLDILTDRMGFQELDMERHKLELSCKSLQPVNERMSEDTLDDCRAFADVVRGSSGGGSVASRSVANSITTGGDAASILETLDEEDEDDEEGSAGGDAGGGAAIHISNLENLQMEDHSDATGKPSDISQTATAGTM